MAENRSPNLAWKQQPGRNGIEMKQLTPCCTYPSIVVSGVSFCRGMRRVLRIPEGMKLLALPQSVREAPMEVLDLMRDNAPLVLGDAFAIDYLYAPLKEQPDLGSQPRALFRGVDVRRDPLAICVPERTGRLLGQHAASKRIKVLVIPKEVEEIEGGAFRDWTRLETVVFEEGSRLSKIGENAFRGSGLFAFAAPPSLRTIGSEAFADCKRLHSLSLNEGLEEIGDRCFAGSRVEQVYFSANTPKIGSDIFKDCLRICEMRLPRGVGAEFVQNLGNCSILQVIIPDGSKTLEFGPFQGIHGLSRVVLLGHSWRVLGESVFQGTSLEEFVAPAGLREVGEAAFAHCARLRRVVLAEGVEVLGPRCFYGSGLPEIRIPASVREIGARAFQNCFSLKSVTFSTGSGLEVIGEEAFSESALVSFDAPASLRRIGQKAFVGCEWLEEVRLNVGLMHLGADDEQIDKRTHVGVFQDSALVRVRFLLGLTKIEPHAFLGCACLRDVALAEGIEEIGAFSFSRSAIERVQIPSSVVVIKTSAFRECQQLRDVVFASGSQLRVVRKHAFENCGLAEFRAPESLELLDDNAFAGCLQLRRVFLNEGLKVLKGAFVNCPLLEEIVIPASVRRMTSGTFKDCTGLSRVLFQENIVLQIIVLDVFANTALHEFTAPESLQLILDDAFANCKQLQTVALSGSMEYVGRLFFRGSSLAEIRLPSTFQSKLLTELLKTFAVDDYAKLKGIANVCRNLTCTGAQQISVQVPVNAISQQSVLQNFNFWKCMLREVQIARQVRAIPCGTFQGCTGLERIKFSQNSILEQIGEFAFAETDLRTFVAPPSLRVIGAGAFANCKRLSFVELNAGLTWLGALPQVDRQSNAGVFEGSGLCELVLRNGLRKVAQSAFSGLSNSQMQKLTVFCPGKLVKSVDYFLPADCNFVKIEPGARACVRSSRKQLELKGMYDPRVLALPKGLKRVGAGWFVRSRVEKVLFPTSVHEICPNSFRSCTELETVEFESGSELENVGEGAFQNCALVRFHAPASLEMLGDRAFRDCKRLVEVDVSESQGLFYVGVEAFSGTALVVFEAPDALAEVGPRAFSGCSRLREVVFGADLEDIGKGVFEGCAALELVQAPGEVLADLARVGGLRASGARLEALG